ncbi:hypothetical protein CUV01_10660 [Paracoccus tegillarcae]|uniref:Uncharacterized protein n=1 Tax=Paracoccus tegillarcae TaxID=1529068 RepID=A0A2K9EFQ5_9RHOB|nr:hypothetical protein CUV01_10660 [Paracoccus tegillarcae]
MTPSKTALLRRLQAVIREVPDRFAQHFAPARQECLFRFIFFDISRPVPMVRRAAAHFSLQQDGVRP